MRWATGLAAVVVGVGAAYAIAGKPPFQVPFPTHVITPVCPCCGLTRGTIATLRGDFGLAVRYNPLSPLVPLVALLVLGRAVIGAVSHHWLNMMFYPPKRVWVFVAVAAVALWIRQLTIADFLVHSRLV